MGALMEVSMCSRSESYAIKSPLLGRKIVRTKRAFSTIRCPAVIVGTLRSLQSHALHEQLNHFIVVNVRSDSNACGPCELLQCAGDPTKVHRVFLTLVCQQASYLLNGSGGSESSASDAILSFEMCNRGTLQNDQYGNW